MTGEKGACLTERICNAVLAVMEYSAYGIALFVVALTIRQPEEWQTGISLFQIVLVCALGARLARKGLPAVITRSGARLFDAVTKHLSRKGERAGQ